MGRIAVCRGDVLFHLRAMNMRTGNNPTHFAGLVRLANAMCFMPQVVCLLGSLWFGIHHFILYAVLFLCMAFILFPPMWICYCHNKKIIDRDIEDLRRSQDE